MFIKRIIVCLLMLGFLGGIIKTNTGSAASKIMLSKKKLTLKIGGTAKLKVKNTKKKIKWTSKNVGIAKVSKKGVVKGIAVGKTKIIAKVGKKKLACKVTVKEKIAKIVYNNDVFDKETYKNIKYITWSMIYRHGEKVSSAEGISAIYKVLAGIDSMKDITNQNPLPTSGGTVIEFVMKDGTIETVNVSDKICFKDKWYQQGDMVSDSVAELMRKYIK